MKHNKKRNVGIIFDLLLKEYVSSNEDSKKNLIENIILKFFKENSILLKEYTFYNVLSSMRGMNERDSERYLTIIKEEHKKIDKNLIEKNLNELKEEISKQFGKTFYNNFIPTYKVYATIYGILNETTENSIEKFELENKILDLMRGQDEQKKSYIVEHLDIITYNQYVKKFNEKYTELSESQKNLLQKYIHSIDNDVDFILTINEELHQCKNILNESLKKEKDPELVEKINKTLSEIKEFNTKTKIVNEDFEFILNLQEVCSLLKEAENNE